MTTSGIAISIIIILDILWSGDRLKRVRNLPRVYERVVLGVGEGGGNLAMWK